MLLTLELFYTAFALNFTTKMAYFTLNFCISWQQAFNLRTVIKYLKPCIRKWFSPLQLILRPFKRQPHKMLKHTQVGELFDCVWPFCGVGASKFKTIVLWQYVIWMKISYKLTQVWLWSEKCLLVILLIKRQSWNII